MHQVFSSHHHFECCAHNDDNGFHNTEEPCFISQFDFVTQFQHNADPFLKPLIVIKRKHTSIAKVAYSDDACFTASSRAPPIS